MKTRYRLTHRGSRGGMFYCVDAVTRKRTSLQTMDEDRARQIVEAKNLAQLSRKLTCKSPKPTWRQRMQIS